MASEAVDGEGVSVDSRARAEYLTSELRSQGVETFVSHGSLSRDERHPTEAAFADSQNCVMVATSTLELGVDIGDLDRVIQIDSPSTVASFLQRLGRTGRRPGTTRNTLFLPTKEDQYTQALGLVRLWEAGFVESVSAPPSPAHLLAQQIMALVLQEHAMGEHGWPGWLGDPNVFGQDVLAVGGEIIDYMLAGQILFSDQGLLSFGDKGEAIFGRRHFMDLMSAFTSEPVFAVRAGRSEVGLVPDVALSAAEANNGLPPLAGRHWFTEWVDFRRRVISVSPASGGGKVKFWGSGLPLSYELCQSIHRVLVGENVAAQLSHRATEKLEEDRAAHSWLSEDGSPVLLHGAG
ncbi:MAG: hypothetical protein GY713_18730 [Actinomycetia bacterium]|nr:hypothetical protein [Actinomycetes bacterium]